MSVRHQRTSFKYATAQIMCATQAAQMTGKQFMSNNVSSHVTRPEIRTKLWLCVCLLNYMKETSGFVTTGLPILLWGKKNYLMLDYVYIRCIFLKQAWYWVAATARSKAWGSAARLLGLRVRIPLLTCLSLVNIVCCQVEVTGSGWSLVQCSLTQCGASECDRGSSKMKRPWPTGGYGSMRGKNVLHQNQPERTYIYIIEFCC